MVTYNKKRPSIGGVFLVLAVLLMMMFTFITLSGLSDSGSSRGDADVTMRQEELVSSEEENSSDETLMIEQLEGESDEDYMARLQAWADEKAREQLEKEREVKEREVTTQPKALNREATVKIVLGFGVAGLLVILGAIGVNYLIYRQPVALVLTEDYIDFKSNWSRDENRVQWAAVATATYKVYRLGKRQHREIYLQDEAGKTLDVIDLNALENVGFNGLQRRVSGLAPHITWVYPE